MDDALDEPIQLIVSEDGVSSSRVNAITQEIVAGLNRQPGLLASSSPSNPVPGHKGDSLEIGSIVLKLLGSGGAVTVLLNGLKGYFLRRQKLSVEVVRKDKQKFKLSAENLSPSQLEATYALLDTFLGTK